MTTALLTVALTLTPNPSVPDGAPFADWVNDVHHRLELDRWNPTPELLADYLTARHLLTLQPPAPDPAPIPIAQSVRATPDATPPAGVEGWRDLVSAYFPAGNVNSALSVISCESRGNPNAKNSRSSAAGLWQFIRSTWDWLAGLLGLPTYDQGGPYNPDHATRAAANLSAGGTNWAHWVCKP